MGDAPERIAVKKTNGYEFNWYGVVTDIYDERGVEYIRADLAPTDAQVMANEKVRALREALRPFDACVVNDNGDVTISTGRLAAKDWLRLRAALRDLEESNG